MKQTIAISAFAGMLSRQSGYTEDFCERFVVEMFKSIADALKETDEVHVKGMGKFIADGVGSVSFIPDDSFAAEINAPFDCFEPEPLDDDVTEEILAAEPADEELPTSSPLHENIVDATPEVPPAVGGVEEVNRIQAQADASAVAVASCEEAPSTSDVDTRADEVEMPTVNVADNEAPNDTCPQPQVTEEAFFNHDDVAKSRSRIWTFLCGTAVGALIGGAAVYFVLNPGNRQNSPAEISEDIRQVAAELGDKGSGVSPHSPEGGKPTDAPAKPDTITTENMATVNTLTTPQAPEENIVYDNVRSTLSDLSRKHYGSYEFWVYIYEENRDIIPNPDRVEPNTRVRIPKAEKYGINPRDRNSINTALKKSQEIALEKKGR